jgi:tetratricopeptide (TPR) repeat protein
MGRLDEALQCFQRSAEIVELYHGSRDPLLAQRRFDLAHVLELMGRFDDAVEQLRQVTSIMRGAAGAADRLALEAMERSGDVRVLMRDYEAAFALYHKAIDGWQCIVGPRHRRVAVLLCKVALMLCRAGEFDVARRYLERGSDILDQTLLPASSDHGLKLHVESLVLFYRDGLYEAALEKLRCSYDCVERVFSHVHVRVATLLADMARMNWVTGRVHEAADHFLWTANCLDRCVHADHVLRMEALLNLGRAQMALGRWKEAEENLSLAARWDRSQPHPAWVAAVVPRVRASLAALLLARGRRAEADEQLGRYFSSRDLAGAQYQRREILESSTVYDVAATMVEKGFPKQALLMQKQRVQLLERAGREYESDLSWALVKKGELQLQLGERAAAFESISRGVLGVCAEQYADTALAGPTAALIVHCAGAGDLSRIEYLLPRLSEMWARLERSGSEGGRAGLEARQFQVASALGDAGLVTYAAPLLQRVVTRWEANPKMARTSTLEHARTLLSRMQSSASGDPALRLTMQQKEEQQPQQHQQQQQQRRSLPYVAAALRPALGATHAPLPADDYGASASSVAASVRSHADSGAPVPTLDGDDGEGGARGKATSTTLLAAPRPFTFAEQLQAMGDAVALRRRTGAKSPLEGEPDQQGAKALLASGKYEEALKQLQDWLDAPDAHSDWEVSWTHTRAAEALRHLGRAREALDHLLKAIVHAECMHTSNRASVVALLVEDATDLLLSLDRCEDAFELVLTRWPKAAAEAVKAGGSTAVF